MSLNVPVASKNAARPSIADRLRHVDLDVADVVAVPDRLEEPVGEPQGEQVVDGLLAQEVVDAEDLRLVEDGVERRVERLGRGQIGAERLLGDDATAVRPLRRQLRVAEQLDDRCRRRRAGRRGGRADGAGRRSPSPPRRRPPPAASGRPDRRRRSAASRTKASQAGPVGLVRPNSLTASRACWRNWSSVNAYWPGAEPTIRYLAGSSPALARWKSPGSSLRLARSPVAPKMTMTWSSGVGTSGVGGHRRTRRAPAVHTGRMTRGTGSS